MATKKTAKKAPAKKAKKEEPAPHTEPKFPYTNKPASLRRLLKEIPKKPKPDKFDKNLLQSWGFKDTNDYSVIRVLKAVGFLNDGNQPTEKYAQFMHPEDAGKALGAEVRRVYAPLFKASHTPHTESAENLKSLFNIHSGGGEATMDFQIGTFKALAENANLSAQQSTGTGTPQNLGTGAQGESGSRGSDPQGAQNPTVNINLHIHLPENKSRREYEDIIEDIGRYIFGRGQGRSDGD
jgi:hypothetical protein